MLLSMDLIEVVRIIYITGATLILNGGRIMALSGDRRPYGRNSTAVSSSKQTHSSPIVHNGRSRSKKNPGKKLSLIIAVRANLESGKFRWPTDGVRNISPLYTVNSQSLSPIQKDPLWSIGSDAIKYLNSTAISP